MPRRRAAALVPLMLASLASAQVMDEERAPDHERHLLRHTTPHPASHDPDRFHTSRSSPIDLPLPNEDEAFLFVVYGDRTGGPDAGINVLKDAVRDTNLLEPDLVMTVGDLIDGYNQTPEWMAQMTEFTSVMDQLLCPWFPVAGNHDVYWRGPNKPDGEHQSNYEMHFGPLWYAFEHKDCWFIALYSDEGDPVTGEMTFGKPGAQRMSPEQFEWLDAILDRAQNAHHVFLFIHHPRWLGNNYGDDWDRVHERLVEAGNVSAVFAGHIHRMRYDPKDGIEYVTLATVGGHQNKTVPDAGWLHHFNIVTVRESQIALSSIPIGEVMDVRELTGEFALEASRFARSEIEVGPAIELDSIGLSQGVLTVTLSNPTTRESEFFVSPESGDSRWLAMPDHEHTLVPPGETREVAFRFRRMPDSLDDAIRPISFRVDSELLMPGHRYAMPTRVVEAPIKFPPPDTSISDSALDVADNAAAVIASKDVALPDGPFTLECWFNADRYAPRTGLVTKTENSEFGLFVSNARPEFFVHLGGRYVTAATDAPILETGRWTHIAGVFDGAEVRLYVDGQKVAFAPASGSRTLNRLPLIIGADVSSRAEPTSGFDGRINDVRLSSVARYSGDAFQPEKPWVPDDDTVILHDMDRSLGRWLISPTGESATLRGAPRLVPAGP